MQQRFFTFLFWTSCISFLYFILENLFLIALNIVSIGHTVLPLPSHLKPVFQYSQTWLKEQARIGFFDHLKTWTPPAIEDKPDLVIAHYQESLSWLLPYVDQVDQIHLYCKSPNFCTKDLPLGRWRERLHIHHLPNEGRESNSYLHHIHNHYDKLPARTVFTMASLNANPFRLHTFHKALEPSYPNKKTTIPVDIMQNLLNYRIKKSSFAHSLGDGYSMHTTSSLCRLSSIQPLANWRDAMLHPYHLHNTFKPIMLGSLYQHGAIFSATKTQIQYYPPSFYYDLLQENSGADLMETGYYMERLWRFFMAQS